MTAGSGAVYSRSVGRLSQGEDIHMSAGSKRHHRRRWSTWSNERSASRTLLGAIAVTAFTALSLAGFSTAAQAVPGTPGVPQATTVVYDENFENGVGNAPVGLQNYVGASGQTYTADPVWLTACNGQIRNMNTPYTTLGNCASTGYTSQLGQLAYALGQHSGSANPAANHAVTAYTDNNPGANAVQFQTASNIPLALSTGRFLTFSVDTSAVNCNVSAPQYQ
jgi:hypothetical protein